MGRMGGKGRKKGGQLKLEFGDSTGFKDLESLQPPLLDSMVVREG